uniref:3-hydroxy-3-methylglutaryl coenzyme A reductase n=1 Tax=Cacopsylla melanoneura TaxID=428564 RepID=A0A8D9BX45_9HEMI
MLVRLFRRHGELCASHPWEVIVGVACLTSCLLCVDKGAGAPGGAGGVPGESAGERCTATRSWSRECVVQQEYIPADMVVMTIIRCAAVLYTFYQFRNLHRLGSKYIMGIAGLFTVCSSFVFSSTVINFLRGDISDLKDDALFFFLLLIDLSKATLLAQFALSSPSQSEVKRNIARGMSLLGPTITLDTIVEALVISVGTLSGVRRIEMLCYYAIMSVLVNYIVFMSFYPACLSLILELSKSDQETERPVWYFKSAEFVKALREKDEKPNPVVQHVKVIMSAGLMIVHVLSRLDVRGSRSSTHGSTLSMIVNETSNPGQDNPIQGLMRWVSLRADQLVIITLLTALLIKFIFFEEDKSGLVSKALSVASPQSVSTSTAPTSSSSPLPLSSSTTNSTNHALTLTSSDQESLEVAEDNEETVRSLSELLDIYKSTDKLDGMSNKEVLSLVMKGHVAEYNLEKALGDYERGVLLRRKNYLTIMKRGDNILDQLPYQNYDYTKVLGQCCENVIGYVPIPVGVVGPLLLDDVTLYVPMATTEGCLVASTKRGCRAVSVNGVRSRVVADGMSRAPVVRFTSSSRASEAMAWLQDAANFAQLKDSFDSSSRFARLQRITVRIAGHDLYVRFVATTGDAMGMNMLSKGTEQALKSMLVVFPDMDILSLSGNFCSDKKAAAVNWIEGRGKSVVTEAIVPEAVVTKVLKTSVDALVSLNVSKNLVGSAIAGSIGGFNAHAANIVTSIFIATGQDPAQNVVSSSCLTLMEKNGRDLYISCTMPSIECGTIGGGTILGPQTSCLTMLGVNGPHPTSPGDNARSLARIICATVMAGELSLMSALAAGHLVRSHLKHNRTSTNLASASSSSVSNCISS